MNSDESQATKTQFYNAAEASSLLPGSGRTVEIRGRRFALFNLDGEFFALDDACPHRQAPLGAGSVESDQVFCPMHGWNFNIRTGTCVVNPDRPVRTYRTQIVDGEVQIEF